jgi:dihydrodipicolinate synthase/N-acetylneuraminate lyase
MLKKKLLSSPQSAPKIGNRHTHTIGEKSDQKLTFKFIDCIGQASQGNLETLQQMINEEPSLLLTTTVHKESLLSTALNRGHTHVVSWIANQAPELIVLQQRNFDVPFLKVAKEGNSKCLNVFLESMEYHLGKSECLKYIALAEGPPQAGVKLPSVTKEVFMEYRQ